MLTATRCDLVGTLPTVPRRTDMAIDASTFRAVYSRIPVSVAVVATIDDRGVPHGMTIGSLCCVSKAPPLLLFCVSQETSSHDPLCLARRYCISVLAHGQHDVARRYGTHGAPRFSSSQVRIIDGLPAVNEALAWLVCTRRQLLPCGDHTIILAVIERAESSDVFPLIYQRHAYHTLYSEPSPTDTRAALTAGNADTAIGARL
jgi:flavin reductase ActVB